ncbi:hypothetical protein ACFWVF_32410 [Streptomyces sp. NPDC058659]|uniref:hypothetical protein n=1 Tax=unclassified Streptomyces TaxID=2593676 RepID=UPI00365AF48F
MTRSEYEVDQIVFRWDSENSSGSTGFGPVAWSGPRDETEDLFRISGPMLRASGDETRPALIRLEGRRGVMLIRRTPFTDADGGTSVLCHALVGSPALLEPAFCLGLHAWDWEGAAALNAAEVRGRLPVVREEVLVPATGRGQGELDETLPYVRRELAGTLAELLRHPDGRFTVLDERGDTAGPVLWGLHSMLGELTERRLWTFASHDTVELAALRFVFVGRWSGAASPNTGRRRVDPRERSGDRAEEIAARLVRHHLRGVAEGDGREYAVASALHEAASARRALLLDTADRALDILDSDARGGGRPREPRLPPSGGPRYGTSPQPRYEAAPERRHEAAEPRYGAAPESGDAGRRDPCYGSAPEPGDIGGRDPRYRAAPEPGDIGGRDSRYGSAPESGDAGGRDSRYGSAPEPGDTSGRDPRYPAARDPRRPSVPPRDSGREPASPDVDRPSALPGARRPSDSPDARRPSNAPSSPSSSSSPDDEWPFVSPATGRTSDSTDTAWPPVSPDAGRPPSSPEPWAGGGRQDPPLPGRPLQDPSRYPAEPYTDTSHGEAPGGAGPWATEVPPRRVDSAPDPDRITDAGDAGTDTGPRTGTEIDVDPDPGPAPGRPRSAPDRTHDPYPRPVLPFVGAQWAGPVGGGRRVWARKPWGREREAETGLVHRLPTARDVAEARGFVERAGSRELLDALRRPQMYVVVTLLLQEIARRLPSWEHPARRELCEVVLGRELWAAAPPGAEYDHSEPPEEQRASNAAELHRWAVRPLLGGGDAPVGTVAALLARLRTSPVPSAREAFWQIVDGDRPGLPDAVWLTLLKEAYGVRRTPPPGHAPPPGQVPPPGHAPPPSQAPPPGHAQPTRHAPPPGTPHHPGAPRAVSYPPPDDDPVNGYTRRFLSRTAVVLGLLVAAILVAALMR